MASTKLPIVDSENFTADTRIPTGALTAGWAILDHLPFPVLEILEDYTVARANRASKEFYGGTAGKCFELSHARDVPCFEAGEACPKAEASAKGCHVTVRHAHATKDGVQLFIVSAYPLDHGGILEFHLPIEETLGRDGLTGLYSRDFFDQLVARQRALLTRMDLTYSIVLLDIDHFKRINDKYGHAVGDKVLSAFGNILKTENRDGDSTGRYGGEEFCVFMPDTDLAGAKIYAERLQEAIGELAVSSGTDVLSPTSSFGVWSGSASVSAGEAIKAADDALYRAKRAGRNCICIADV